MKIEWKDKDDDLGQAWIDSGGCVWIKVHNTACQVAHLIRDRKTVEQIGKFLLAVAEKMPPTKHTFREKMPDGTFWVGGTRCTKATTQNGAVLLTSSCGYFACSLDTEWSPT